MLPGFSEYTDDLTDEESKLLPYFIKGLSTRVGSANAISNSQIRQALKEKKDIIISDARVRKIIAHICNNEIIEGLIATSKGYYVSRNYKEVDDYEKSLLGREHAIALRRQIVSKYKQKLLSQQQHFF
jgi:hypothetical protein